MTPLLSVENLSISFEPTARRKRGENGSRIDAVRGLSFTIERGEIVGIVGESGCGKSVTALALLNLLGKRGRRTSDVMEFEGGDLLSLSPKEYAEIRGKEISLIRQDGLDSLNPLMKIGEQIGEPLKIHLSLSKMERRDLALKVMREVGLKDVEYLYHLYPHKLSGGMRQRVMIAMAIICEPRLLIADEATTALDVTVQAQILDLLRELNRRREMTILFISHDLAVIQELCDQVIVMSSGKIVERGEVSQILRDPQHPHTQRLLESIPMPPKRGGESR